MSLIEHSIGQPLKVHSELQYSKEAESNVIIDLVATAGRGLYRTEVNVTHPATQLNMHHVVSYFKSNIAAEVIHRFFF